MTYDWNIRPAFNIFFTEEVLGSSNTCGGAEPLERVKAALNGKSTIAVDVNGNPHIV